MIPTSKCQFWLSYILAFIIVHLLSISYAVVLFNSIEISFDCWKQWSSEIWKAFNISKTELILVFIAMSIQIFYPCYLFKLRNYAKELSIIQNDFNSINLLYPDDSNMMFVIDFNKIPIYSQYRSRKVIIMIFIIPAIMYTFGFLNFHFGFFMFYYHYIPTTASACLRTGFILHPILHAIISTMIFFIWVVFLVFPMYCFIITYIDISHLFLSWSESLQKSQGMERLALLSHVKSFINLLNHYKKVISPFIFWTTLSQFILILFDGYQMLSIAFANVLDLVVNKYQFSIYSL